MMTLVTQVFGVRGDKGDLCIAPALLPEQFDEAGTASISLRFAERDLEVIIENPDHLAPEQYTVGALYLNGQPVPCGSIPKERLVEMPEGRIQIRAVLQ